jgi:hypothetical protein
MLNKSFDVLPQIKDDDDQVNDEMNILNIENIIF